MPTPKQPKTPTYITEVQGLPLPYPMLCRELLFYAIAHGVALFTSIRLGVWIGRLVMPEPTYFRLVPVLITFVICLTVIEYLVRRFAPDDLAQRSSPGIA